jgi:hypothetical protein
MTERQDRAAGDRVEELYRRWDAVRARTGLVTAESGGGLGRVVRFLRRTLGRVRNLGVSWDLQRDLFRALLDRQITLQDEVRGLREREQAREPRLAAAEAEMARLRTSDGEVRGAIDELRAAIDEMRVATDELRARLMDGDLPVQLASLRDRQEVLRTRQAKVEGALADLREQLDGRPGDTVPLTPRDLAELLPLLDDGTAGAVEVSFQDVRAETLLLAARRHFGGRLAASGPEYRSPNDLWIHADFTACWDRPILLGNAAARLAPGGRLALLTAAAAGAPPEHPELERVEDRVIAVSSGGGVRVVVWRRN